MKHIWKRLGSSLLVFAMLLSLLPGSVFAADENTEAKTVLVSIWGIADDASEDFYTEEIMNALDELLPMTTSESQVVSQEKLIFPQFSSQQLNSLLPNMHSVALCS